jgi:flagellar biosynthesis protein FlhF
MSTPSTPFPPGAYRFQVKTPDEAVALIREKLGPGARVVSVNAVPATGWWRLFKAPRLEVVAQIDPPAAPAPAAGEPIVPLRTAAGDGKPEGSLTGLLRRSGLTETALTRLQSGATWSELTNLPLHRALAETSRLLCEHAGSRPPRAPISRAAFIGSAGVGRTTALCKWLSVEVFRRERRGHVVTVEFEHPNALGPLPVFSEALGVPVAHFPCETQRAVEGGFVYFDLPALSTRHPEHNAKLAEFLDREQVSERVLVLNAAYDRASLREAYAAGKELGATHLAFTHLDEVPQWGKLWDYLFDEDLEPLFLTTGPSLTGEWEEDVPAAIARRTLPET